MSRALLRWGRLSVLGAGWARWLLPGFPQVGGRVVHPQVVPLDLGRDQVHLLDRGSKAVLFLAYYTLLPPVRLRRERIIGIVPVRPGVP